MCATEIQQQHVKEKKVSQIERKEDKEDNVKVESNRKCTKVPLCYYADLHTGGWLVLAKFTC